MKDLTIIVPDRLTDTLAIPWFHPKEPVHAGSTPRILKNIFRFNLGVHPSDPPVGTLTFDSNRPRAIELSIEGSNGYHSTIHLDRIARVTHKAANNVVLFEIGEPAAGVALRVWARGDFELFARPR